MPEAGLKIAQKGLKNTFFVKILPRHLVWLGYFGFLGGGLNPPDSPTRMVWCWKRSACHQTRVSTRACSTSLASAAPRSLPTRQCSAPSSPNATVRLTGTWPFSVFCASLSQSCQPRFLCPACYFDVLTVKAEIFSIFL